MKRKIALAMAVSMLITSVPVNSITGLAEEAVIVEDVIVEQQEGIDQLDFDSDSCSDVDQAAVFEEAADFTDGLKIEEIEVLEENLVSDSMEQTDSEDELTDFSGEFLTEEFNVLEENFVLDAPMELGSDGENVSGLELISESDTIDAAVGSVLTLKPEIRVNEGYQVSYYWTGHTWTGGVNDHSFEIEDNTADALTITCDESKIYNCAISDEYGTTVYIDYYIFELYIFY